MSTYGVIRDKCGEFDAPLRYFATTGITSADKDFKIADVARKMAVQFTFREAMREWLRDNCSGHWHVSYDTVMFEKHDDYLKFILAH